MKVISARKMPIVPRVTMNGSILPMVTMSPLNRPHSAPTQSTSAMPAMIALPPRLGTMAFMNMIMMPVTKAVIEPTDRSSPPEEMTKVAPTAMMAMKAERVTTLVTLVADRKSGLISTPTMARMARAMKGPMSTQLMRASKGSRVGVAVISLIGDVLLARRVFRRLWPPARRLLQ